MNEEQKVNKHSVLFVLESWGDGGTEAYVDQLGRWLAQRGWKLDLCLLGNAPPDLGERVGDWAQSIHILGARGPSGILALNRLVRRKRPTVCHLHLYSSLLPAVLVTRAVPGVWVISTLHLTLWQWNWRHRLGWRIALFFSHAVTGVSQGVLGSINREPGGITWLTPPPLPPAVINALPARAGGRTNTSFHIVGAGRLAPQKDWPTLLHAVSIAAASLDRQPYLKLFGDGPLGNDLREAVARFGISDITELVGNVPRDQLLHEIRAADVFVLPSRFEGLPMGAMEAMAVGTPTILADFDASGELVEDGITGHRFPRGDAHALANLFKWHAQNPRDACRIASAGRASVIERFHEDSTFIKFDEAYRYLVTK